MDGQLTEQILYYERISERELLDGHMYWISECAKLDLWKDISDTYAYKMRELYYREIIIRRDAQ